MRNKNRTPLFTKLVLFPIIRIFGRKFPKYYRELKKTEYLSRSQLEILQLKTIIKK